MKNKASRISTEPYLDQKAGTSGLRKNVKIFKQKNYTENFVQSILQGGLSDSLRGSTIVIGGDGRYYMAEVAIIAIQICAGNGVKKVIVGQNGIFSTPAVSHVIRKYKTNGGIILTASHNPGGPDQDFGIKYNMANGGPATEAVTNAIFEYSKKISDYQICTDINVNLSEIKESKFIVDDREFAVSVIDPTLDYTLYMKEIFDFNLLKTYLGGQSPQISLQINALNGVMGPYVKTIFLKELNVKSDCAVRCDILPDFGGGHPDPNLTYAAELVTALKNSNIDFGAAFDGDGDRNMILGKRAFFVTPSDSLAIIAEYIDCIPYFKKHGVTGYARSMPTAGAVDRVAHKKDLEIFETPTGWKFFGNLMDAGRLCLCGEESFGTGSNHIREKDGMWAVLAWLSILASTKLSVEELLMKHWKKYGRNFFTRYDYENCDSEPANQMMSNLEKIISDQSIKGRTYSNSGKQYTVKLADNFKYKDPIDGSFTEKQGIRFIFSDDSRIIFRLSGTGSSGATIRLYVEGYEADPSTYSKSAQEVLKPLVEIALQISKLRELTGRESPTVIT